MRNKMIMLSLAVCMLQPTTSCFAAGPDIDISSILAKVQSQTNSDYIQGILNKSLQECLGVKFVIPATEKFERFNSLIGLPDENSIFSNTNITDPVFSFGNSNIGSVIGNISADSQESTISVNTDMSIANQMLECVNQQRAAYGVKPLSLDSKLTEMAQYKAQDMSVYGFSHDGSYGGLSELLAMFGVSCMAAGENIAMNQSSVQEVMNSWMNSQGHRANILSSSYSRLGVGYYVGSDGSVYWVQEFAG